MLQAIKKTLAYANIFNYPLTSKEIHYWLIGKKASLSEVQAELKKLNSPKKNSYRKNKDKIAEKKWQIAIKITKSLKKIPTVLSILVTGNLSMNNSGVDDDIDMLIIAKKNTIWTTRFLTCLVTDLLKVRRRPLDKTYKDKICLNMFLDEDHLKIKDQNIYTAHELLQAKPLFDKNNTYQKFISANSWAKKYLPNAFIDSPDLPAEALAKAGVATSTRLLSLFEPILSFLQKQYMAKRITREKISDGQLFFHPQDIKAIILKKYASTS